MLARREKALQEVAYSLKSDGKCRAHINYHKQTPRLDRNNKPAALL